MLAEGGTNRGDDAKSRKQVHKQLKVLGESLKMLATNVSSLGIEMGSVLNAVPVDESKDETEKENIMLVPLAGDIRKLRKMCDQIALNVESLRQRLEV